jgi:hypothetical protein
MGSTAIVISTAEKYIINSNYEWIRLNSSNEVDMDEIKQGLEEYYYSKKDLLALSADEIVAICK